MTVRIGIDTGGTFTDVVRWSPRGVHVHKLPSTPDDPGRAVLAGIAAVRRRPDEPIDVVHGTTVALNAVLQDRLPRTVFVTNKGFRDLIEIGRQERTELYALEPDRPMPPVPREQRVEVDCRRAADGEVLRPLTDAEVEAAVARVRRLRPAAVAVGLLHSPTSPQEEQRLCRALRRALPRVPVTASAELYPSFGEYERFSAAILNAAVTPLVAAYVADLQRGLGAGRLRLMRSSLGIVPSDEVTRFPARAMFSGPAGGVLATERLARAVRAPRAAAFDMGGTSTDVCLVQSGRLRTDQGTIAGLPLPLPSVDMHTVGCGGGSIAFRDAGGALRVGPLSAGADPGPACYGRGDEPTVTDAHVALGHLGADTLLGGGFPIDPDRSVRAIERLSRRVGLGTAACARGILAIADVAMARALMRITGERAVDPADVPLVAYGGAGGLHAAALADRLGMPWALVPLHPGAFSALGLALAGESIELVEAVRTTWSAQVEGDLRAQLARLAADAAAALRADARDRSRVRASTAVRLRYRGQGGGIELDPGPGTMAAAFRRAHLRQFGFVSDAPIEVVQLAARAELPGPAFPRARGDRGDLKSPATRRRRRRPPAGGAHVVSMRREELQIGSVIAGPCIIEEATAATRIPVGWTAEPGPFALRLTRSAR